MKSRTIVASDQERDRVFAELYWDDEMWAELSDESGVYTLRVWGKNNGEPWKAPLDDVLAAIGEAKKRLGGDVRTKPRS
jgi:hypothetical protein